MLCDYFIIRRRKHFNIEQLYTPGGLYWYRRGVNWRAIGSYFVGMIPLLPSLMYQINPNIGGIARDYMDFSSLAWIESALLACLSYYLLSVLLPLPTNTDVEDNMAWAIQGHKDSQGHLSRNNPGGHGKDS
ncbi:MAG: hypothetical protein Q9170_008019 [Blastenia crenularia]